MATRERFPMKDFIRDYWLVGLSGPLGWWVMFPLFGYFSFEGAERFPDAGMTVVLIMFGIVQGIGLMFFSALIDPVPEWERQVRRREDNRKNICFIACIVGLIALFVVGAALMKWLDN